MYRITVSELFPLEDKYNPNCTESSTLLKRLEGEDLQELIRELLYEATVEHKK